jgi:hypothetical protein
MSTLKYDIDKRSVWNYGVIIAKEYGNTLEMRSLTHVALNVMK